MSSTYGVIDLFAGPGGLGEGFASLDDHGHRPFRIALSVEKEASAHRTLTLRAFIREYVSRHGHLPEEYVAFHAGLRDEPDWHELDPKAWRHATREAQCLELGTDEAAAVINDAIDDLAGRHDDTLLIGGPPCQAYSLVGRSRSKGIGGYRPEDDARHFLFREYIRVLDRLRPAAFVLENVKGVLSSKVNGELVFEEIMHDLSSLGGAGAEPYRLQALRIEGKKLRLAPVEKPRDFITRAEDFGVPQRRHRVIIVGIRADLAGRAQQACIDLPAPEEMTVGEMIGGLEKLRSGLSRTADSPEAWRSHVTSAASKLSELLRKAGVPGLIEELEKIRSAVAGQAAVARHSSELPGRYGQSNHPVLRWVENEELIAMAQHASRSHMPSDLERYLFISALGKVSGDYARKSDWPEELAPDHRSWEKGIFSDRFRVQLAGRPSTTITSHISKDGHYFIHHDPEQCRSLTVREAARLQTFPDDYLFLGNRTQQYVQVGNAVPPYLARQIADLLLAVLNDKVEAEESHSQAVELTEG